MKRKGVFIAAGIGLILLVAGILIYISIKNPEALTKAPIDQPIEGEANNLTVEGGTETSSGGSSVSTEGSAPQITQQPKESAGRCLVTTEINCSKAFITHQSGKTENDGIGFSGLVSGTTLFAPIDGYVHFYSTKESDGVGNILSIATTEVWSPNQVGNGPKDRAIQFFGYGVEPLIFGKVKKGDPIGKFNTGSPVLLKFITEKSDLVVTSDTDWNSLISSPSSNAVEYINQLSQAINN